MKIQVLGLGCQKCHMLTRHAEEAVRALGLHVEVEAVADMREIAAFGILSTPALAVDGRVIVSGRVPSAVAIQQMLTALMASEKQA